MTLAAYKALDYLWLPVGIFMVCLAALFEHQVGWRGKVICGFSVLLLAVPALIGFVVVSTHDKFARSAM